MSSSTFSYNNYRSSDKCISRYFHKRTINVQTNVEIGLFLQELSKFVQMSNWILSCTTCRSSDECRTQHFHTRTNDIQTNVKLGIFIQELCQKLCQKRSSSPFIYYRENLTLDQILGTLQPLQFHPVELVRNTAWSVTFAYYKNLGKKNKIFGSIFLGIQLAYIGNLLK